MDIKYLRNFIEIVECGSISEASRKLFIAQPALSNQVKNLEKTFDTKLLVRNARSVTLTDAGAILYKRIKDILNLLDAANKEISECTKGLMGTLWLGISPTLPDPNISALLLDFHEMYPAINIELYEANADPLVDLLINGIVEVIFFRTPENAYPMLNPIITISEMMTAIYHRTSTWLPIDLEYVPISMLKDVPITTSRGFQKVILQAFEREGLVPNFLSLSNSRAASLIWVERGMAVAIAPTSDIKNYESEKYCCRPIGPEPIQIKREFAFLRGRKLSSQAQIFLDFCIERFLPEKKDEL